MAGSVWRCTSKLPTGTANMEAAARRSSPIRSRKECIMKL